MAETSQRPLCRYFLHGTCRYKNGECLFSHDMSHAPSFTCKYFLQGCCVYGDACRYDHVRPAWAASRNTGNDWQSSNGSQYQPTNQAASNPVQGAGTTGTAPVDELASAAFGDAAHPATQTSSQSTSRRWAAVLQATSGTNTWEETAEQLEEDTLNYQQPFLETHVGSASCPDETQTNSHDGTQQLQTTSNSHSDCDEPTNDNSSRPSRMLCTSYAARGMCPAGDRCAYVHGDECQVCHKHVLNPVDPEGCEQHIAQCTALHARLSARLRSADVECGICLEKVMSAPKPSDRWFGLLSCNHAFCLKCIRAWRREGAADIDTAVRACPVCRATSYFITPSTVWPTTAEEKETITSGYKAKLATIDCRHFNRGEGNCPFGTSCFYRHMYRDGTLQDREACLRTARDQQGGTRVLGGVRLSDFFGSGVRAARQANMRFILEAAEAMLNGPNIQTFPNDYESDSWADSDIPYEFEENWEDWGTNDSEEDGSADDGVVQPNTVQ